MPSLRDYGKHREHLVQIAGAFDHEALRRICEMDESEFGPAFGMQTVPVPAQKYPDDFFFYKDNGAQVLAVAHLDTVVDAEDRRCRFVETEGSGTVVFSGALDDRLGAYIILDLLPKLGITYDILLTVGEETGNSTAAYFDFDGKEYDWIIEFDRGGTDVVMYQYEDPEVVAMVEATGARVDCGSFSDISYMEHLGIKAFNWGVGYQNYHSTRGHAFLADTFDMVAYYLTFHEQNEGTAMPHYQQEDEPSMAWGRSSRTWDDPESWRLDDNDLPVCDQCGAPRGTRCGPDCPFWEPEGDDDDKDFDEYPSSEAMRVAIAALEGRA